MPHRSSLPKNSADSSSNQRASGGEERRTASNVGQGKPVSPERLQAARTAIAKQSPSEDDAIHEGLDEALPLGREARFRSDLEQVAQQLRGIQFGSLMITIQDGVVVQLDRTERTRLRKPQLPAVSDGDSQQGMVSHTPVIRREPRHPDC